MFRAVRFVVGVGSEAVLRREVKYAIAGADYGKLRTILETNLHRVSYGGPSSTSSMVRSIYFDDARLSACRDNLHGVSRRFKLRLRWYDDDDTRNFYFEIKRRIDLAVLKQRIALQSDVPLSEINYRQLAHSLKTALPQEVRELFCTRCDPVLISEYRRDYFEAPGSPVRVTLDRNLTSYLQTGLLRPRRRFAVRETDVVILEAKAPLALEPKLRELIHPLRPIVTKFSKYVAGCQRLGLMHAHSIPM